MQEKEQEVLSVTEQKNVLEAVYTAVKTHVTDIKTNFESFEKNTACISLFSETGAVYTSKNIMGGFTGQVPFYIVYRGYPQNDRQKFQIIKYLEKLSEWICEKENYPVLGGGRVVENIKATSAPFLNQINNSGANDYAVPYQINFRKDDD